MVQQMTIRAQTILIEERKIHMIILNEAEKCSNKTASAEGPSEREWNASLITDIK